LEAEFFGLPNVSLQEFQFFGNKTYTQRWIKLLPFFSSLIAVALVCFFFSHVTNLVNKKNSFFQILNAPYIFNSKVPVLKKEDLDVFFSENVIQRQEKMRSLFELTYSFQLKNDNFFLKNYQIFLQTLSKAEMRA
jgi:hypothetical protein